MKHGSRSFRRGNTIIEMALVLPILLYMSFAAVEYGYFLHVKHVLQGAASEGARAALPSGAANMDVTSTISNMMTASGLGSYNTQIVNASSGSAVDVASAAAGTQIKIVVACNWGTVGVRPLKLIAANKTISGACVVRK